MWVLGGGRVAPNPSNEVDIYDPGTDSWSLGTPFSNARRNFPADSDGTRVWLGGGYDVGWRHSSAEHGDLLRWRSLRDSYCTGTSTPHSNSNLDTTHGDLAHTYSSSQCLCRASRCLRHTRRPRRGQRERAATETPATPAPTATACTVQFTDVPPNSTFYPYIHCLVCLGIVNGYPNGTFRPNADVTRGQLSKIVANSAGFNDTPSGQQFQDVPPTGPDSTFYVYIYRLVHRGYINGYPCGGPL